MPKNYFSCLDGPGAGPRRSTPGPVTPNLCFCILFDLEVMLCILVDLGCETSMHYFSFSGGPGVGPTRSTPGHITPNLCFCFRYDLEVT
jgi:hypothetical protein